MRKLTFQSQLTLAFGVLFICLLLSTLFHQGLFANAGWVLYGLLFVLHPVPPTRCEEMPHTRLYVRLAGALVIFLGLITHFGV